MMQPLSANGATTPCLLRRDKLVSEFCEVIPSTASALDAVVERVQAVAATLPCAPEELDAMELALREALANAILHGNHSDPSKKVIIACFCECAAPAGVLLVVRDEGAGFDPSQVPDPTTAQAIHSTHGRGIFLMRQFMDGVRFRDNGCEVELRKHSRSGCLPESPR